MLMRILFDDDLPLKACKICGQTVAIVTTYPGKLEFPVLKTAFNAANLEVIHGRLTAEMESRLIHHCKAAPVPQQQRLIA